MELINLPERQKILDMLILQDKLNTIINQNWLNAQYPFLRAAFVEAAEALEHHGWKWWKAQQKNLGQLQIEIVDILHFYLSDVLVGVGGNYESSSDLILNEINNKIFKFNNCKYVLAELEIPELLELLGAAAAVRVRSFSLLNELMVKCELSWDEAYKQYIFKNILNLFRQANGYASGNYIKEWDGVEDNIWLEKAMNEVEILDNSLSQKLWSMLDLKYTGLRSINDNNS